MTEAQPLIGSRPISEQGQIQGVEVPNVVQESFSTANTNTIQRFYRNLVDVVHDSILEEPSVPEEPFCKLDCLYRTADYNLCCKHPCKSINDLSPTLRRGRSKGWLLHRNMIFPLASTAGRTVWVTAEFIAVFITLGLSIARYSCGNNYNIFNTVHLALSIFASFLSFVDVIAAIASLIGKCVQAIRRKNSTSTVRKCCNVKNIFDVGRMVFSELIFYPLLICAMFDMILLKSYFFDTEANQISFVLFIMSAILLLGFVYTPRIAVPLNAMYKRYYYFSRLIDITITKSSIHFQNYFILHSLGQIVSQVVMTAANGILIHIENENFVNGSQADYVSVDVSNCFRYTQVAGHAENESFVNGSQADHVSVNVSCYLWYTLVAGYILPFLGLISFFLTTYWWLQEFPIGISIDFITILSLPNFTKELLGIQREEGRGKINGIIEHFRFFQLKQEFGELHDQLCFKIFLPFITPPTVIFSLLLLYLYAGYFTSAFFVFAFNMNVDNVQLDLSWYVYLCTAVVVVYFMNLYAFSVASIWTIVIGVLVVASFFAIIIITVFVSVLIPFMPLILLILLLICCLYICYINREMCK